MNIVEFLPTVNATLNGISGILLTVGYVFIRRGKVTYHKRTMISAFVVSALFLTTYLIYHYLSGSTPYIGQGWDRTFYFVILISHIILAAAIVPLVLITLFRAWKQRFLKHKAIARWTLPIWLYVSVTGVLVYFMLYHLQG